MPARTALSATLGRTGRLTILIVVLVAGGCGFQPRGQGGATGQLDGSYGATGIASNSTLYRALRRSVTFAGGTWVEQQDTPNSLIHIQSLTRDSRVLSVDSRNRAVEFELEETVRFVFRPAHSAVEATPQTIRVLRALFRPPDAVVAGDRERVLIRREMQEDLADRIVRRISLQQ